MKVSSLLGTSFAVLLMASPGIALAQGNTGAGAMNSRQESPAQATANAQTESGGVAYRNIGQGSHTGEAMPIANNNGNNGGGGVFGNNNGNGGGGVFGNNGNNGNGNNAMRPSQRNPLLADNGDVRIGKMIGTNIYNERNQQIGSVNGVVAGRNGLWAIVSTNNKKVAVPFRDFVFGDSNANGNDKLVLPNYTQAKLNTLPVFHYNETNYANNGGGGVFGSNGGNGGNYASNGR